ncbi:hypothetical protein AV926_14035 [Myroides marinus]|uniref:Uncharacterized protein n=1 Tax=Myroides marinus TaxID=703342 RepID=A0A163XBJ5_9FLAO|nr:hypothetical protein AV926_14035 [Myroides marinus]
MLKLKFSNVLVYIFVKYLIIFFLFMVKDNNFKLLELNNIKNGQDLFYYLWIILFFPIIDIILFSIPLYYSLKIKNMIYFILSSLTIFGVEYLMNVYFTSQKILDIDVLLKVVIGVILFFIFFYKNKCKLNS